MSAAQKSSVPVAFAVATVAIALFSGMDALMKHLALALGTYNALLWRTMAGAVFGGLVFLATRTPWPARAVLRLHLIRGSLSVVMALTFFWGLARVPLAHGVALAFVAPLIALFLAALILKEKIERRAIYASMLGFAGVVVILAAQAEAALGPEALQGSLSILCSAGLYAYNIILMRQQAQVARPIEIAFFMSLIMTSGFMLAAPLLAEIPPASELPAIGGAAALAFASLILLSWAYARAEAQYLAPVEYTAFIWAATFGVLIFAEPVRPLTVFGAAMIVVACLIAARRSRATDPATGV
ncbi:MAG: DMT family transporter [Alphaproteobacteria bacterium]|nr:MAG: DMT family transporter [Alphaproteobacteria bacterium]